ncbi:hypothetical protein CAPTEDRAFT_195738 [Capitella teleta]|uniref:IgGFc-binding protein N-terminal domain-containing protein n=1 Tax=Capitella teleta TaxID=283909 RepID=R7UHN3_CAPTE|nr:hypothetical protein CAPTEDRAFT_195738 [Capitella teleta]|eukprot:ELU05573.1 hypothetical protein CAPTEDRAFT_195738 [Capitella teleta]
MVCEPCGADTTVTNGSNDDDDSMMMQGDQAKAQQVSQSMLLGAILAQVAMKRAGTRCSRPLHSAALSGRLALPPPHPSLPWHAIESPQKQRIHCHMGRTPVVFARMTVNTGRKNARHLDLYIPYWFVCTILHSDFFNLCLNVLSSSDDQKEEAAFTILIPKWIESSAHLSMWLAPNAEPSNATLRQLQQPTSRTIAINHQQTQIPLSVETKDSLSGKYIYTKYSHPHEIYTAGFSVRSQKNAVLDATAFASCQQNRAAYQHLPIATSGMLFVIAAVHPHGFQRAALHVIGLHNETTVTITEPQYASKKSSLASRESNQNVMQVSLSADEISSYDSAHDLTGFSISSNHPISLFVETEWLSSRAGHMSMSPQLPVSLWGCSYMDMISAETGFFLMYKITAAALPTYVQFWTMVRSGTLHMMYSPQTEVHVSAVDKYILLKADRPILVTHVLQSLDLSACRSTTMHSVPPLNHWNSAYRFILPESKHVWITTHDLSSDFTIDGVSLSEYSNNTVQFSRLDIAAATFAVTQMFIDEGDHTLSSSSGVPFVLSGPQLSLGQTFHEDSGPCIQRPNVNPAYHTINNPTKEPHHPVVFRIETLGGHGSSRVNNGINLHQTNTAGGGHSDSSGASIIAVVVSTCMAVVLVILCIGGFVLMDLWNRRQLRAGSVTTGGRSGSERKACRDESFVKIVETLADNKCQPSTRIRRAKRSEQNLIIDSFLSAQIDVAYKVWKPDAKEEVH